MQVNEAVYGGATQAVPTSLNKMVCCCWLVITLLVLILLIDINLPVICAIRLLSQPYPSPSMEADRLSCKGVSVLFLQLCCGLKQLQFMRAGQTRFKLSIDTSRFTKPKAARRLGCHRFVRCDRLIQGF